MNLLVTQQQRKLLAIDFSCALLAGVIYFILFDWMIVSLALPEWIARIQLYANLVYGIYGACLFVQRGANVYMFKFLIGMNATYALFCIVLSAGLFLNSTYLSALLLLIEGAIVMTLAKFELDSWILGSRA